MNGVKIDQKCKYIYHLNCKHYVVHYSLSLLIKFRFLIILELFSVCNVGNYVDLSATDRKLNNAK